MDTAAQRIMALFAGNMSHHGTHGAPDLDPNGVKWVIKRTARTLREPVTLTMWEQHIEGIRPLGVIPINEENKCRWGSIDIDEYDIDILEVVARVEKSKLPLVPCRSKSGGLHLFLFTQDYVDASLMQSSLKDIAASLGFGTSEIFPKQTRLLSEQGDMGNWIVMPYYGGTYNGKLKNQFGLKKTGAEMALNEFLTFCEKKAVPGEQLTQLRVKKPRATKAPFTDGPPCLVHLSNLEGGIPQGGQNNTLFHMGVYFKRAFPNDWPQKLEEANQLYMRPVHPSEGVASVIRSLEKKDYEYKCKDQPMCSHCDAMLCRTRKFGVGAGGTYPIISGLSKLNIEPAIWFVDVEGTRLSMSTEELQNYNRFHRICMEYTHKCFAMLRQDVWLGLVSEAMNNMTLTPAPPEVGLEGRFQELLETFLTNRQRGEKKEDLLSGRPWEDEDGKRHYFRLRDLAKFLEREGMKEMTRGQMTLRIKKMDGGSEFFNIKNKKGVNVWYVPSSAVHADPEIDTPRNREDEI